MKRKNILAVIALIAVFALAITGCGAKEPDTTEPSVTAPSAGDMTLSLTSFSLSSTTWSSPNGATIHLTATPVSYTEGQSAAFVVRLEGEEVENIPCDWDGTNYTAAAELNAADGYCYYVILTAADGSQNEVPVNTPTNPTYEPMINMAAALESYCNVMVEASDYNGSKLTITAGSVEVQAPRITNAGETITCAESVLVLTYNGEELDRAELTLSESEVPGGYDLELTDVSFDVPAMEDDQQLSLRLDVTLSNGQFLSASGCTWSYIDGQLISAVG